MKSKPLPDDTEYISRSAQKREAQAAKAVGERLAALNADQLHELDLPAELLDAIFDYQQFTSHGARRRQMLLIGKYMRELDKTEIEARVAAMEHADARSIWRHHQAEQWRDRLVADESALGEFFDAFPDMDRDGVKTLLRRFHHAADETGQRTHKRALYRFIHDSL